MQNTSRLVTLAVLALGTLAARPALADTYTYTGNDFNVVNSPYTSSESITGSFTTAGALGANLSDVNVASLVTSYSFTDGINTLSSADSADVLNFAYVWTNASGQITEWSIDTDNISDIISVFYEPGGISQPNAVDKAFDGRFEAQAIDEQGSWSVGNTAAVTPEPSSLALFGTGAFGMIAAARRRLRAMGR